MPKRRLTVLIGLLAIAAAVALFFWPTQSPAPTTGAPPSSPPAILAGRTMGGTWSVKLPQAPSPDLAAKIPAELARLESIFSLWRPESDLARFNRSPSTDWQPVPAELADIAAIAGEVAEQSGGAFDITVAPLVNLWGFGPTRTGGQAGILPADAEIAAARALVGWRQVEARLEPPAIRKSAAGVQIDLGAIAKGYAADAIARTLDGAGEHDYLIAIGGELRARGTSGASEVTPRAGSGASLSAPPPAWPVAIATPTPDVNRALLTLDLAGAGLSTSGDYRNFFTLGEVHYGHELDPRTGRPVPADGPLASVSVLHPSSARADAWATALFVLGPDEGYATALRRHLPACFILRGHGQFELRMTPEFQRANARRAD